MHGLGCHRSGLRCSIFESETFRKQIYYLAVTAVQPEIREDIFRQEFLLTIPKKLSDRDQVLAHARRVYDLQEESRLVLSKTLSETNAVAERLFEG
jgi:type I restriction enzyme M protein